MTLSVRIMELPHDTLEEFIEIWAERKSTEYAFVERIGQASDKGRDIVGFKSRQRYEGKWDLFQCKRKTIGKYLEVGEALTELGKMFVHHLNGEYATLPDRYIFVSPRSWSSSLKLLTGHPTKLKTALLDDWGKYCSTKIKARQSIPLSPAIRAAIESYDFGNVEWLSAAEIARDPAAKPALVRILQLLPDDAPSGFAPEEISDTELGYLNQLKRAYEQESNKVFADFAAVFAAPRYGKHMELQRDRFYDACAFRDFHRDNTGVEAVDTFKHDIYHLLIDVYNENHISPLARVDAVMKHTGATPADILGKPVRGPVKQGTCHHLVTDGRLGWVP